MIVGLGNGKTEHGPGIKILLTGDDIAQAVDSWLVARGVVVSGPRTTTVNNALCDKGSIYVDPSGCVIAAGKRFAGSGTECTRTIYL